MRVKHRYIQFDSHLKIIQPVKKILDKYSCTYNYEEDLDCVLSAFKYNLKFELYEDATDFAVLQQELSKFKLEPQIGTIYEKAEIEKAEWFIISKGHFQYPQPDGDFGYREATFDLKNYCHLCGIGKVQNAPYRLKTEPKQRNHQFWGLHWVFDAIFVRREAKNILKREQIKGISFSQPVLHKKNLPIEDFYQLHIHTVLNKGFDSYNTKIITCKFNNEENWHKDPNLNYCGRIKYHHPMIGGYLFDKQIFNKDFDIVETYEYFGSGASANKLQIVSKRFKEIVEKNKLKGLVFEPIMHEKFKREIPVSNEHKHCTMINCIEKTQKTSCIFDKNSVIL